MKETQKEKIIRYIREYGSITSLNAYKDLGVTQLGARLAQLKKDGYIFKAEFESGKNRFNEPVLYKRYYLEETYEKIKRKM